MFPNTWIKFLGATIDNTGFGRLKVCHWFKRTSLDVYTLNNQHHLWCSQEFIWKLTSITNHRLEDELHAQVNTRNMYLENNEGKHIHCWATTQTPSSYLRGIDGQSLEQEPAGIRMKTIMKQEVSKIDQRDVLILMWSQIICFLQTGDSKGAISNCTPVQSSFIKHKPQRIFWL